MSEETSGLNVSDHAIARYVERILGADMDELKDTIREMIGSPKSLIEGAYPSRCGEWRFIIKGGNIVTIRKNSGGGVFNWERERRVEFQEGSEADRWQSQKAK